MALTRTKYFLVLCFILTIVTFVIVHQLHILNMKPNMKGFLKTLKAKTLKMTGILNDTQRPTIKGVLNTPEEKATGHRSQVTGALNTQTSKVTGIMTDSLKPKVKDLLKTPMAKVKDAPNIPKPKGKDLLKKTKEKWKRCKKLISGEVKLKKPRTLSNDSEILHMYKPDEDCAHVLQTRFVHPPVTKEEKQLPIAFGLTVYKGARLLERILRAIYMPNNVYCIHIDKKSPEVFREEVRAMIRCLPNVFIAANSTDVVWGHFTVVQAQMNCMEGLLQSSVKWKYYISLIGQDFPLYDNKQIVRALQGLNNTNSIGSYPMPKSQQYRTKVVFVLTNRSLHNTHRPKAPPPHNISIYKGSTHIVAIREFIEFVLHSHIGKDLNEFLKDSFVPDETLYASLQRHPDVPGGINGTQPIWIPRALYWLSKRTRNICRGIWVRSVCWIQVEDLRWALGEEKKENLFVHKIPFNFNEELIECILVARQDREYATAVWIEDGRTKS